MNFLLLTDMPPCDNYTAGIVQMQLCRFLLEDAHNVDCYYVIDPLLALPHIPDDIQERMSFRSFARPRENYGVMKYGSMRSFIWNNYHSLFTLRHIANDVKDFACKKHYDLIWSIAEGQSTIKLVRKVSKKIKTPYVVQVWDPPQWWLMENQFDVFTAKSVMREFGTLLHEAKCCLAASWSMAEEYKELYQANTQEVVPGLPINGAISSNVDEQQDDFRIAFAGQMYAGVEFQQLINALNEMRWEYDGRSIKLFIYGNSFSFYGIQDGNIILRGWVPQEEMISEISGMDLLYCPYWFSEEFKIVSRLSFPSKLTSYLRSGVAVLIHAPEYASISRFITNRGNGYVCNSLQRKDLQDSLAYIISDQRRKQIGRNGFKLYKEHLTDEQMKRDFYRALGMDHYEDTTNK